MTTEPITEEQLAAWEAVERAATAGPWSDCDSTVDEILAGIDEDQHVATCWNNDRVSPRLAKANTAFIVAARTALPALLVEVRRLRAELAQERANKCMCQAVREFTNTCKLHGVTDCRTCGLDRGD